MKYFIPRAASKRQSNFVCGLPFPASVAAAFSACRPSGCRGFFFFFRRRQRTPAASRNDVFRRARWSPAVSARRSLFRPRPFLPVLGLHRLGDLLPPALARSLGVALVFTPPRAGARALDFGDSLVVGRVVAPVVPEAR